MTENEAIKIISLFREEWDRNSKTNNAKALDMAIDALEKQEPKKPIGDLHSVPHYRCSACHGAVKLYETSNTFPYCHWCGQALDWEDEDD